jgi:hypothetical protein
MQATVRRSPFQVTPGRTLRVVTLAFVASPVLGAAALVVTDHLPPTGAETAPQSVVVASANPGQGEGLLGQARTAAAQRPTASVNPYAGDGRLNVTRSSEPQLVALTAPFMGEGRLNVRHQIILPYAGTGSGQGEGLVRHTMPGVNPCR